MKIEAPLKGTFGHVEPAGGMPTPTLNTEQFMGGPEEARKRNQGFFRERTSQPDVGQQHLFLKESVPLPEAHHQTPQQFAEDPRTWWHGRYAERVPKEGNTGEGFHAGTEGAARIRLTKNFGRKQKMRKVGGVERPQEARVFPLRMTRPVPQEYTNPTTRLSDLTEERQPLLGASPEQAMGDTPKHKQLGPGGDWTYGGGTRSRSAYFYKNEVEDFGHISLGVANRSHYLATHKEMVAQAQKRGEYVHPNIAWAAKKATEHTGEDVVAHKRWNYRDEELRPKEQNFGGVLHPSQFKQKEDTVRFETAAGKHVLAWRDRGGLTTDPKLWHASVR